MSKHIQQQCDKKLGRLHSLLLEVETGYRLRAEMEPLLREAYTILNGPVIDEQAKKRWLRKYRELFRED